MTNHVTVRDNGAKSLLARVFAPSHPVVRVGVLDDAPARRSDGDDPSPMTNLEVAVVQEFGAPEAHIPPRSFIRGGIDASGEVLGKTMESQGRLALAGKITEEVGLERIGMKAVACCQRHMAEGIPPPLSPVTIERREHGGTKPLVDTGQLKSSITYKVVA